MSTKDDRKLLHSNTDESTALALSLKHCVESGARGVDHEGYITEGFDESYCYFESACSVRI